VQNLGYENWLALGAPGADITSTTLDGGSVLLYEYREVGGWTFDTEWFQGYEFMTGGHRAGAGFGTTILAFDDQLRCLWRHGHAWSEYGQCPAYIPAIGDIDGDGRDEINAGYFLLNPDGTERWRAAIEAHMDSVSIAPWIGGEPHAFCSGGGQVIRADGEHALHLGIDTVPHGQELRVGHFAGHDRSPVLLIRHRGHEADTVLIDHDGELLRSQRLNETPNNTGMETLRWHGAAGGDLLVNGDTLWDPLEGQSHPLPSLPPLGGRGRMDWWHAIPIPYTSGHDELLLYNPWQPDFYIFGPAGCTEALDYRPGPRQWNVRLMN